jgi:hypothetical protein
MSVIVMLRVPGDPDTFERYSNDNRELMLRIVQSAKDEGLIHHQFAAGDGEIVVIDEWPDEAAFQRFFEGQPDIPRLMQEGGATGAPQISFHRKLTTPDVV